MTDRITDRYGLAEYECARREGRIVEGDAPATEREKVDTLIRATEGIDDGEREWAAGDIRTRGYAYCWTERYGRMTVKTIEEWNACHGGRALKADA